MTKLYIHKHIQIVENTVFLNEKPVFSFDKSESFAVFAKAIYQHYEMSYSKFHKMDALSKLGFLAADLLLDGIDRTALTPNQTAMICANKSSSLRTDTNYQATIHDIASPAVFVYTLANIVLGEIAIKNDIKGESLFFVQDTFDTNFFSSYLPVLFSSSNTKLCVAGWIEMDAAESFEADLYLISEEVSDTIFTEDNLKNLHTSWKN